MCGGRRAIVAAEGAIEIGQIGETGLGGDVGYLAITPRGSRNSAAALSQAPFQHVMRETLAGLFKKQMHVARRDAELTGDCQRAEIRIGAAAIDLPQDGGAARRA